MGATMVAELENCNSGSSNDSGKEHASLALLYTLPEGRPIWGVTSLGDELFVVRESAAHVEVYRYTTLCRRLQVPALAAARDLAACNIHLCLYITDVGNKGDDSKARSSSPYAIHRSVYTRISYTCAFSALSLLYTVRQKTAPFYFRNNFLLNLSRLK